MRLYHFTALTHLPAIVREGLRIGLVPIDPTVSITELNAPNLTKNPNPTAQAIWCRGIVNKTKIRMTVEVPDTDLTSFRQIKDQYKMRSSWVKALDPYYERRHWYFAFGGVPVEQIKKIEIFEDGVYRELLPDELQALVARIEEEKKKKFVFTLITSGPNAGYQQFDFKNGHDDSWLLDGHFKLNGEMASAT